MANSILIMKFRKNDLTPSKGKQIEFASTKAKFFFELDSDKEETEEVIFYCKNKYNHSKDLTINAILKYSPVRKDYKIYQNTDGSPDLKDYLINTLKLSEEENINDYFALKKIDKTNFEFYYFPQETTVDKIYDLLGLKDDFIEIVLESSLPFKSTAPLILYGPPGTGKTHKMQKEYIDIYPKENGFITTFHQSFSYEEFVEGLKAKPTENEQNVYYEVEPGIFYKACEVAAKLAGYEERTKDGKIIVTALENMISDKGSKLKDAELTTGNTVLLCIDEINRANVSAVFGDLISLIEPSKRIGAENELIVNLPYSKKEFGVPSNLFIVGTMNTADRSIQLLDSALRRRFEFEELLPDYSVIENEIARNLLKSINNRIRSLIGKNYQIGHSYFIGKKNYEEIFDVLIKNVIPLLEEYFYEETEKIKFVLNEKGKDESDGECFYILDSEAENSIKGTDFENEQKYYLLKTDFDTEQKKTIIENIIGKVAENTTNITPNE